MASPSVLVTLTQAKGHLRIRHTEEDEEIQDKLDQAEDIVLDYLHMESSEWDTENVPGRVQAAVLEVLADLWEHRGDDNEGGEAFQNRMADGELHPRVTRYLYRLKDLVIA
jgi:hypothetical protein